ncbi:hypothetical protein MBH78_23615 [Oceanimonas sp. NS1]|nr:hypothetical protein [Oceanimonas sp. NS1]
MILCAGKVYYDLLEARRKNEQTDVAIIRIEQLYPFPQEEVAAILADYQHVQDFVWCQEEPQTRAPGTAASIISGPPFRKAPTGSYAGRSLCFSPAVGHPSVHLQQQKALVEDALTLTKA